MLGRRGRPIEGISKQFLVLPYPFPLGVGIAHLSNYLVTEIDEEAALRAMVKRQKWLFTGEPHKEVYKVIDMNQPHWIVEYDATISITRP